MPDADAPGALNDLAAVWTAINIVTERDQCAGNAARSVMRKRHFEKIEATVQVSDGVGFLSSVASSRGGPA